MLQRRIDLDQLRRTSYLGCMKFDAAPVVSLCTSLLDLAGPLRPVFFCLNYCKSFAVVAFPLWRFTPMTGANLINGDFRT